MLRVVSAWAVDNRLVFAQFATEEKSNEIPGEQLVVSEVNLVRMLEFVQLTEDEKVLVTEKIELYQALIEKLVDVPTLAGPTPRELEMQRRQEK